MYLAIGDVVRDHTDMELGTVIGKVPDGSVVLQMSGGAARLVPPYDFALVARRKPQMSGKRAVATLVLLVIGFFAACIGANSVQVLGGDWLLTCLAALGGFSAVTTIYTAVLRLARPRGFRV